MNTGSDNYDDDGDDDVRFRFFRFYAMKSFPASATMMFSVHVGCLLGMLLLLCQARKHAAWVNPLVQPRQGNTRLTRSADVRRFPSVISLPLGSRLPLKSSFSLRSLLFHPFSTSRQQGLANNMHPESAFRRTKSLPFAYGTNISLRDLHDQVKWKLSRLLTSRQRNSCSDPDECKLLIGRRDSCQVSSRYIICYDTLLHS